MFRPAVAHEKSEDTEVISFQNSVIAKADFWPAAISLNVSKGERIADG